MILTISNTCYHHGRNIKGYSKICKEERALSSISIYSKCNVIPHETVLKVGLHKKETMTGLWCNLKLEKVRNQALETSLNLLHEVTFHGRNLQHTSLLQWGILDLTLYGTIITAGKKNVVFSWIVSKHQPPKRNSRVTWEDDDLRTCECVEFSMHCIFHRNWCDLVDPNPAGRT